MSLLLLMVAVLCGLPELLEARGFGGVRHGEGGRGGGMHRGGGPGGGGGRDARDRGPDRRGHGASHHRRETRHRRHTSHRRHHHRRRHAHFAARHDAWNDWRRFRTINHLIHAGVHIATRPRHTTTVVVTGTTYYYASGYYYVQDGTTYVVVAPPPGAVVYAVPASTTVVYAGETKYYYDGGTYYVLTEEKAEKPPPPPESSDEGGGSAQQSASASGEDGATIEEVEMTEAPEEGKNYKVVPPPVGATVPYLPDDAKEKQVDDKKYWVVGNTWYMGFVNDGDTIYMVVNEPKAAA